MACGLKGTVGLILSWAFEGHAAKHHSVLIEISLVSVGDFGFVYWDHAFEFPCIEKQTRYDITTAHEFLIPFLLYYTKIYEQ